jgi:hypothetical protein
MSQPKPYIREGCFGLWEATSGETAHRDLSLAESKTKAFDDPRSLAGHRPEETTDTPVHAGSATIRAEPQNSLIVFSDLTILRPKRPCGTHGRPGGVRE